MMNFKDKINSYYHLAKPRIVCCCLLTAAAGFLFASHWSNNYATLVGMLIGLGLVVGCAGVLSSLIDRDIDSRLSWTKKRAMAATEIKVPGAVKYTAAAGILGLAIIAIYANILTLIIALFGLLIYVIIYDYVKRKTIYGALVGAFAGALAPVIGYCAFTDSLDIGSVIIFLIFVCWQLVHFHAIALYRQKEYRSSGLPIWPNVKGVASSQFQVLFAIGVFSALMIGLFVFGYVGYVFLLFGLALGLGWLWYCSLLVSRSTPSAWGKTVLTSSLVVILLLSIGLAVGPLLA